jgi:hypothetical protein
MVVGLTAGVGVLFELSSGGVGAIVIIAVGEIVGVASEAGMGVFVGVILGMLVGFILLSEALGCVRINTAINNVITTPSRVRRIAALFLLFLFIIKFLI